MLENQAFLMHGANMQSERGIVTDVVGTTRDVLEASVSIHEIPVILLDTAGIRETADMVERISVQRSEAAAMGADMIIFTISALDGWTHDGTLIFERIETIQSSSGRSIPLILVINKIDCVPSESLAVPEKTTRTISKVVCTCAVTGHGIQEVESAILKIIGLDKFMIGGQRWTINQRQCEQLLRAREALSRLKSSIAEKLPSDFWTIELRETASALGHIGGTDISEEVLSNIFSKFCIGRVQHFDILINSPVANEEQELSFH